MPLRLVVLSLLLHRALAGCMSDAIGQGGDVGGALVKDCQSCFQKQTARGCTAAKFCAEVTGVPWCGPASTSCDTKAGAPTASATSSAECANLGPSPGPSPSPPGPSPSPPGPSPPSPPSPPGHCKDDQIGTGKETKSQLVGKCQQCWDQQAAVQCKSPRFCSGITGMPWCDGTGSGDTTCDDNTNGVNISRDCCSKYTDHTIAYRCGGLPCPNHQATDTTATSCNACFAEAADINCTVPTPTNGRYPGPAFCTSTLYGSLPWCGPKDQAQYCQGTFITDQKNCPSDIVV